MFFRKNETVGKIESRNGAKAAAESEDGTKTSKNGCGGFENFWKYSKAF